jgi:hypothetical protein
MNYLPMPASGGSYIRNQDGSLTLETPALADDLSTPEADPTPKPDDTAPATKAARVKEA